MPRDSFPLSLHRLFRLSSCSEVNPIDVLQLPELNPSLEKLEALLAKSAGADDPFLSEVAGHLISAGGKRLRPALTICSALASGGEITENVLLGGVAVELVHLASLYHDDVMDEATARRGVASVNARWGNNIAVVSGDFLLARAAGIAASLGTEVAALLASTLADLCEGQIIECQSIFDTSRTEEAYFASVKGKTAALMATSCRIGAIVSGADRREVDALTRFGTGFGIAFQVLDDILDIIGEEAEIGKLTGQDLAEGIYTLPTLRALTDQSRGKELEEMLGKNLLEAERAQARSLVASTTAVSESVQVAMSYVADASKETENLKRPEVGRSLARLASEMCGSLVSNAA